jgi:hypothetical protein
MRWIARLALLLLAPLAVAGCGSAPPPEPDPVKLEQLLEASLAEEQPREAQRVAQVVKKLDRTNADRIPVRTAEAMLMRELS